MLGMERKAGLLKVVFFRSGVDLELMLLRDAAQHSAMNSAMFLFAGTGAIFGLAELAGPYRLIIQVAISEVRRMGHGA